MFRADTIIVLRGGFLPICSKAPEMDGEGSQARVLRFLQKLINRRVGFWSARLIWFTRHGKKYVGHADVSFVKYLDHLDTKIIYV